MQLFQTIGAIGGILFIVKLAIHIYIRWVVDKKFPWGDLGTSGHPLFFLPIMDTLTGRLKTLKRIANGLFVVSILLIVIFLIGNFFTRN